MNHLKEIFQNLLSVSKKIPVTRGIYAVNSGQFAGKFFVFIQKNDLKQQYCFLSMPKMDNREVPYDSFTTGIKNKIITYIKSLPRPVYQLCETQYKKNLATGGYKINTLQSNKK